MIPSDRPCFRTKVLLGLGGIFEINFEFLISEMTIIPQCSATKVTIFRRDRESVKRNKYKS